MGDSLGAALVSFGTGLVFVSLISLVRKDVRAGFKDIFKASQAKQLPSWRLGAGVLGASFVAISTHVVPIAGVALFTVASLAGQTAISLWVDHIGVAGSGKTLITKRRVIAALITVSAVVLSAWDRFFSKRRNQNPLIFFSSNFNLINQIINLALNRFNNNLWIN